MSSNASLWVRVRVRLGVVVRRGEGEEGEGFTVSNLCSTKALTRYKSSNVMGTLSSGLGSGYGLRVRAGREGEKREIVKKGV
jgi:hypothetical protein